MSNSFIFVLVAALLLATASSQCVDVDGSTVTVIDVSASSSTAYTITVDGTANDNPNLQLYTGFTYTFNILSATSHPFMLKNVQNNGNSVPSEFYMSDSLSSTDPHTTSFTFIPTADDIGFIYYVCQIHSAMTGEIHISAPSSAAGTCSEGSPSAGTSSSGTTTPTPTPTPTGSSSIQCYVGQEQMGFSSVTTMDCPTGNCLTIKTAGATQYQCNSCVQGAGYECCQTNLCNKSAGSMLRWESAQTLFVLLSFLATYLLA